MLGSLSPLFLSHSDSSSNLILPSNKTPLPTTETVRVLEDKRKEMGELCENEEKRMRDEMLELDRERKQLEEDVNHLKTGVNYLKMIIQNTV